MSPPHDPTDDFGGFRRDLPHLLSERAVQRRRALRLLGGAGLAAVLAPMAAACSSDDGASPADPTSSSGTSTASATGPAAATGAPIPAETQGPFPADGSNGPDVLTLDGIVRTDLRTSIGDKTGTAEGVALQLELTVVDAATRNPEPDHALYLWHCTADGRYSIYEVKDQNYLRGVAVTDDAGRLTATTVFPGCYPGRWPHVHFEIYRDAAQATGNGRPLRTSQLALPQADCERVYADRRYGSSAQNLSRLSLSTDMVFADGWSEQLATVSGSPSDGTLRASLLVRV